METEILTPFLNRTGTFDPAGWFQLVPKGVFPIARKDKEGQVSTYLQVVDDVAIEKMDAAFKNRRAGNPEFRMLIDFEHFSHDTSKSSAAACWVTDTEKRADGLWAKGEWSDEGEAAIKNRRYRYLSPVWFPRQTERLGDNKVRPIEVNDAGLTNKPNLGEALQPFWNRAEDFHGREATTTAKKPTMIKVIALLGLAATATEDDVVARVQAFKNRVAELEPLTGKLSTLQGEHDALKNRHTTLLTDSVTRALEENKDVIPEEQMEAWKNRLTDDFTGTASLLKGLKRPAAGDKKKPLHKPGKGAAAAAAAHAENVDEVEGDAFVNRVTEVAGERKVSKAEAEVLVASEEPELYEAYRNRLFGREAAQ